MFRVFRAVLSFFLLFFARCWFSVKTGNERSENSYIGLGDFLFYFSGKIL